MTTQARTPAVQKSAQTPSSQSSGSTTTSPNNVQLKQSLQGRSFAEQESMLAPVQQHGGGGADTASVHAAAAEGTRSGGGALPHLSAIQKSFGGHDVSAVQAHTGGAASAANEAMGAEAYATGNHIAFKDTPDLHTAAHEAAHVVQQRGGVSLPGGVGSVGDSYEQHADQVADAVVKGESAEPILNTMSGRGGGAATQQKVQKKAGDANGITGGKVTLQDHNGGSDVSNVDKTKANLNESVNKGQTLADMAKTVKTGAARGEKEMLAAIAANTMPRFVARVGPKKNFGYGTFGRPNEFIFATEPADLAGLHPAAAMYKVGWEKASIVQNAEQPIAICIFDTSKAVPSTDDPTKQVKVGMGKMEWPELKVKATGDSKFVAACTTAGITDVGACFDVWAKTPVKGDPKTSDPILKDHCNKIRVVLNDQYGANPLYSGMGATIQEDGKLGAREVMVTNSGTGFKLTPDNHVIMDTTPTKYTKSEAEAL